MKKRKIVCVKSKRERHIAPECYGQKVIWPKKDTREMIFLTALFELNKLVIVDI